MEREGWEPKENDEVEEKKRSGAKRTEVGRARMALARERVKVPEPWGEKVCGVPSIKIWLPGKP